MSAARVTLPGALTALALLAGGCGKRGGEPATAMPASAPTASPAAAAARTAPAAPWLTDIAAASGIDFVHHAGGKGAHHMPEIMAGGGALLDFDGDGDLDVFLVNGNDGLPGDTRDGPGNRLYRREPDGRYTDVTEASGLKDGGYAMGVATGDIDNDGDVDVYVTHFGTDRLYRNVGGGRFEDITERAGIRVKGWSSSAAFFDYDRDGFLDLYVARYVDYDPKVKCFDSAGRPDYCSPKVFHPLHDVLLHNEHDGTFTDVSEKAGMTSVGAAGLGVVCMDVNDDGLQDIYVANDGYENNLWINQGDGRFKNEALLQGVALDSQGRPKAGMGVVSADLDGDGELDFYVTNLLREGNSLYRSLGPGKGYTDATSGAGLGVSSMPFTGFGTLAVDLENDGDLDLVVANGRVAWAEPLPDAKGAPEWRPYAEPNLLYLNDGKGRFELRAGIGGTFSDLVEISRGLAAGDIDGDGDLDLLLTNIEGPDHLYRNDAPSQGHWLIVRVLDPRLKRDAYGARVRVVAGDRKLVRTVAATSGYLSSSDPRVHLGLGPAARVDSIEVRWPDGLRERFPGVESDRAIELRRGSGEALAP